MGKQISTRLRTQIAALVAVSLVLSGTAKDLAARTRALFTGEVLSPGSTRAVGTPGPSLGEGRAEHAGLGAVRRIAYGQPLLVAAGGGGDIGHDAVVVWLPRRQQ